MRRLSSTDFGAASPWRVSFGQVEPLGTSGLAP
jgi:hypothetical protein